MKRIGILICAALGLTGSLRAVTLDAAMHRTLENNIQIQQARLAVEQAAGHRLVLRSVALPDISLSGAGGLDGGKRASANSIEPFGFVRGFFTQPLFSAAIPASFRAGDIELLLAEQQLNLAVTNQLHAARVAFYAAIFNDSLRALGEAQQERLEHNVVTQTDRYQAGQADRGAVTAATLLERELAPRIEDSRRAYDSAVLTLAQAMGVNPASASGFARPEGSLSSSQANFDLENEIAYALKHRADLRLARLVVRSSEANQRIIEAAYYPSVIGTISGEYIPSVNINKASSGSPGREGLTTGPELRESAAFTWRVIDNGKIGGQVSRQRSIREINELLVRKLEQNVPRELAVIQNNLRAAEARQKARGESAAVAEKNVEAVQQNLSEGLSSQMEFRTAEASFLQARAAALSAAYQQNVARAEWDRASGRYFQFSDDTARKSH